MINKTGYPSIDEEHLKNVSYFKKNPIIPNISVYDSLIMLSKFYRNECAVDCLDLQVSYNKLIDNSVIISRALKELGIKKGDIVTVSMPNFYQAIAVFFAANRIGAVTTFLNSSSNVEEVKYYLNLFESSLFINFDKTREYNEAIKNSTKVKNVVTLNKMDINKKDFNINKKMGYDDLISFNDLESVSKYYTKFINPYQSKKNDSLILFTSGSTGNPKSVVLTNENILASGIYLKNSSNLKPVKNEKCLVCVPFAYPYGFATSTLLTLLCGRTAVLGPNLNKDNISYYLSKNPNIIFGSPALLEMIMRNVPQSHDLSSVHTFISGGDFLTPSQKEKGEKFFKDHNGNVEMSNGSGNAETVGAGTNHYGIDVKADTVGKVLTGSYPIIIDPETFEEKKYNEEGTLCISGKNVFKEYYKEPELTKEAKFEYNGKTYFNTGTNGILYEDGYFKLTGRASRFFIMSTLNKVYLDHVQNAINMIDIVDECAVVKQENQDLLFVPKAYIVLKDDVYDLDRAKDYILTMCNGTISNENSSVELKKYEIPTDIEFIDQLPRKSGTEKIDYDYLENMNKSVKVKKLK